MSIYKKRVSIGQFLKKGEDFKDGSIIEIASEGKQIEGQFGMQDIFLIKVNGKEGNINFNSTSINSLIDGYGADSVNWIGKKAKVMAILSNVQGKMIKVYYFLHPDTELDEASGTFSIPGKGPDIKQEDIPIIETEEGGINPKNIPF
jgi:hypothetical protein